MSFLSNSIAAAEESMLANSASLTSNIQNSISNDMLSYGQRFHTGEERTSIGEDKNTTSRWDSFKNGLSSAEDKVTSGISTVGHKAVDEVASFGHMAADGIDYTIHDIGNVGSASLHKLEDLGSSAKDNIIELAEDTGAKIDDAAHFIWDEAKKAGDIVNPSHWWEEIKSKIEGLLKGTGGVLLILGTFVFLFWDDIASTGKKTINFAKTTAEQAAPYVLASAMI